MHFYKNFVFITCLKQIFLGTTQFGGTQKNIWGGHCSRMLPVAKGLLVRLFLVNRSLSAIVLKNLFNQRSTSLVWNDIQACLVTKQK